MTSGTIFRGPRYGRTLLALLFAGASVAQASSEYLVQDFGQAHRFEFIDAAVSPFALVVDDVAYFYRHDGIHGQELWRSDGTSLGTYLLRDVCPGICGAEMFSSPYGMRLAAVGDRIYFAGNDGVHGTELWVTDGTAAGTEMVRDIRPGPLSSELGSFGSAAGRLYFGANDGVHGFELWRSDGTAAGTQLVADLAPGPANKWITSTDAGTGTLFVRAGNELWSSDGTAAGTQLLHSSLNQPYSSAVRGASYAVLPDGTAVFQGCTPVGSSYDCELWRSDGTVAGTTRIVDIYPGPESSSPQGFEAGNGAIWFTAAVPNPPGIWSARLFRTDGTAPGTVEVPIPADLEPWTGHSQATVVGSRLFFTGRDLTHGAEPWVTDGVTSELVADLNPGSEWSIWTFAFDRPNFVEVDGALVFAAQDAVNGWRLWRSEGTAATTVPISDFDAAPPDAWFGGYQAMARPAQVVGKVLLTLHRSDRGLELWGTDGTAAGTSRIRTIAGSTSAFVHSTRSFYSFPEIRCHAPLRQGILIAPMTGEADGGWYFSDGVPGSAGLLRSWTLGEGSPECASFEDRALAFVPGVDHGIWETDGTAAGTQQLLPLSAGSWLQSVPAFGSLGSSRFVATGATQVARFEPGGAPVELPTFIGWGSFASSAGGDGELLFHGGAWGLEVSDGQTEPVLLAGSTEPPLLWVDDLTLTGSSLFFTASDEVEGTELWASDATVEGTGPVRILRPGPTGGLPERTTPELYPNRAPESRLAALGEGRVVFLGDDGATGFELWTSDGTEAGTVVVADIAPGPDGSWPRHLVSLGNGIVLFAAEHPKLGYELFRTDGTAAGTSMVRDLVVGPGSSVPDDFVVQDGVLYFSAWTPAHGREAWRSDGTFAGTYRLTDVAPGPLSSSPSRFVRRGNRLFFTATDHVHGFELWARADDGSVPLFIDGFETGDAGRWSAQNP